MHADMLTTAIQHPMCHAKSWRAVGRLFHGFSVEVFLMRIFDEESAVEKCARGKRMNRRSHKIFPSVGEMSHANFYGLKTAAINGNKFFADFAMHHYKHRPHAKALEIKGQTRFRKFAPKITFD